MVYLPFLSDFVPFAKSHFTVEGRRKKEEGRGKREEVLWFIFRFYLIYHLPKVILP
ncbi:hypothetical protein [Okeania sp. KiyG1]|uniref:hypothetical protein n=1 Tax=Okeania sp. KiyG1 TaxID=2720165 RepID=UPI0019225076|nr:hypothetical protein [Okeania sp. KiyG1]